MALPVEIEHWYQALAWSVGAVAAGLVCLFLFYGLGELLTVLVDIERNTRPANVERKRYWALPLLAFVSDLMGLLGLLAGFLIVALIWLTRTGVIGPATRPAAGG
jgi:hypothetical protein